MHAIVVLYTGPTAYFTRINTYIISYYHNHERIIRINSNNPLPDDKILDWSKLKQSADDNFEFDVNSRKFSKLVENTVG